jgi:hypothetical protein
MYQMIVKLVVCVDAYALNVRVVDVTNLEMDVIIVNVEVDLVVGVVPDVFKISVREEVSGAADILLKLVSKNYTLKYGVDGALPLRG